MSKEYNNSRRAFLKLTAGAAGLAVVGYTLPLIAAQGQHSDFEYKILTIHSDNSMTVYNTRAEMGQGVTTSLTQLLLDELDADWSQIREVKNAWADAEKFGAQTTIGAISTMLAWDSHRQVGGRIKLLLRQVAAKIWNTPLSSVKATKGILINKKTSQKFTFGELTGVLQGKELIEKVELKRPESFTLIGKSMPRLDVPEKINGIAKFGIDKQLPGMKTALVARCPVFGGKLRSFDDNKAKLVKGVTAIFTVPSGVAVVANNFWQAHKARQLLSIKWEYGEFVKQSDESLQQMFTTQLETDEKKITNIGDVSSCFNDEPNIHIGDFHFPLVAHMTMEPMNCTVWNKAGHCHIWAPTQNPQDARTSAAKVLNIDKSLVTVNVTLMGGGLGRRAQDDFVIEACEVAKLLEYPVKVVWSREDDLQHDYYRSPNHQRITVSLDQGKIEAWQHKVAALAASPYHFDLRHRGHDRADGIVFQGAHKSLYDIENFQCQTYMTKTPMPIGILRGISHGYTNFACEVTIDELAEKLKKSPLSFRLSHIKEPRAKKVLELLEQKLAKLPLTDKQYVGTAFGFEKIQDDNVYQYYNAVAAVVEKTKTGLKVDKIIMVLDHGQVINPDGLLAQAQGSTIFALGMMFNKKISLKEGKIEQGNFDDYPVPRIGVEPKVELHTIDNHIWPMGVGEKLQGTIQPAIANALYYATGIRIRSIPIDLTALES